MEIRGPNDNEHRSARPEGNPLDSELIPVDELWALSYYRASELAGALFLGRLARRTADPELVVLLTEHFAEEAYHAWLWTDTIRRLGHQPIPVSETYQSRYGMEVGVPTTMAEFLALTHVIEARVYQHFTRHSRRPNVHPIVKQTLITMLNDEEGHLKWVLQKLDDYQARGIADVRALMARYKDIDKRAYRDYVAHEKRLWDFLGCVPS